MQQNWCCDCARARELSEALPSYHRSVWEITHQFIRYRHLRGWPDNIFSQNCIHLRNRCDFRTIATVIYHGIRNTDVNDQRHAIHIIWQWSKLWMTRVNCMQSAKYRTKYSLRITHIELHQFPNKFALYFFWFATDHADAADASARYLFITCCIPRK